MFDDDERGNEHSSENSEPRKRKRVSTGSKYEKVKIGRPSDNDRERNPQYDNDRPSRDDQDRSYPRQSPSRNSDGDSYGGYRKSYDRSDDRSGDYRPRRDDNYGNRRDDSYGNRRDDSYGNRWDDNRGNRRDDNYGNRRDDNYGNRRDDNYGNRRDDNYGNRWDDNYGNRQDDNYGNRYDDDIDRPRTSRPSRPRIGGGDRGGSRYGERPRTNYGDRDSRDRGGRPGGRPSFNKKPYGRPGSKPGGRFDKRSQAPMRQPVYHFDDEPNDKPVRLNKFIANTGLCSRREADEYIKAGLITVNEKQITELGVKVLPTDDIKYNGVRITAEKKVYILLNKPKDYVTSVDDPHAKRTVMELVKGACRERIYPVGRLDRMTTGVLLLTNDGELTKKMTHPNSEIKKIYQVRLDKEIEPLQLQALLDGIELEDGMIKADNVGYAGDRDKNVVGIELHSGKNRVVRRMFEHIGFRVTRLDRIFFGGLTKKGLSRGKWRYLLPKEVGYLRMLQV